MSPSPSWSLFSFPQLPHPSASHSLFDSYFYFPLWWEYKSLTCTALPGNRGGCAEGRGLVFILLSCMWPHRPTSPPQPPGPLPATVHLVLACQDWGVATFTSPFPHPSRWSVSRGDRSLPPIAGQPPPPSPHWASPGASVHIAAAPLPLCPCPLPPWWCFPHGRLCPLYTNSQPARLPLLSILPLAS